MLLLVLITLDSGKDEFQYGLLKNNVQLFRCSCDIWLLGGSSSWMTKMLTEEFLRITLVSFILISIYAKKTNAFQNMSISFVVCSSE